MGIQVGWDQDTILHWKFDEAWDIADFFDATSQSCQKLDTRKTHVDLILSFSGYRMPPNFINHLGRLKSRFPEDTLIVMVETNRLIRSIVNITCRVFGMGIVRSATTLEEARVMILDHQDELRYRTRRLKA